MQASQPTTIKPLSLRPFLLLLLALAVLAGASLWLTAWCWPRYGERACSLYVQPVDFLMSLAIFALVTLVFDQSWGKLVLYSIAISAAVILGSLAARLIFTALALPFHSFPDFLSFLGSTLVRLLYLAAIQTFIPAAILRGLLRRDAQRITLKSAAIFGVILGAVYAIFITALFGLAAVLQPGSVAPVYNFTWTNMLSALTLGLAAFVGVLVGKRLRT